MISFFAFSSSSSSLIIILLEEETSLSFHVGCFLSLSTAALSSISFPTLEMMLLCVSLVFCSISLSHSMSIYLPDYRLGGPLIRIHDERY